MGEWLNGSTNFADVSGYSPAGTHDGFIVGSTNCVFTNDVPLGHSGQSLFFYNRDTGIAISNSSTGDANYRDTFDNRINNAMTVSFWAKGFPGAWNAWVSKFGETTPTPAGGWQLRQYAANGTTTFTLRGTGSAQAGGDDQQGSINSNDGKWHLYVGTYDVSTHVRSLYVDGVLSVQSTDNGQYTLSPECHLAIGARDQPPGNSFGNFSTCEIYDVCIFNFAPTMNWSPVAWRVAPGKDLGNLILTWPLGTLLQATNLAGPWGSVRTGSPYTNSMTGPQMFFKVSISTGYPVSISTGYPL